MITTENAADKGIPIRINDENFFVHSPISGSELRSVGRIPETNVLFLETPGPDADIRIDPAATYDVKPGSHFYDLPPGTVGSA